MLWFIELLRQHPLVGFLIGLVFAALMFGSKNLVVYLYSRSQQKQAASGSRPPDLNG